MSPFYHKCTKSYDHMLYCSCDMARDGCNCYFSCWTIFCPFTTLTARKMKISKKWKKRPGNVIILHNCTKNCDPGVFLSTSWYHRFYVPNWVCKRAKAFSYTGDMKKSARGLQSMVSPPIGPGQSPGGVPRGKAPRSSTYLGFENLLL